MHCSSRSVHLFFHAVMPWCTQAIMCRCTLIFDVHYHIIPYVHSRNLVSPGSPRHGVAQPGGGFGQGHLCTALQSQRGPFVCRTQSSRAGHGLHHALHYSQSTKQTAKTFPSNANKGVHSESCHAFLPRTERRSHSLWEKSDEKSPRFINSPVKRGT